MRAVGPSGLQKDQGDYGAMTGLLFAPGAETAFRIARHFGVGLEDVFGWLG